MNTVDRIKEECKKQRIPVSRLEKDLGFANGYIGGLRKGYVPSDRLLMIAKYLKVSDYYLLTGKQGLNEVDALVSSINAEREHNTIIFGGNEEDLLPNEEIRLLVNTVKDAPPELITRLRYYAEGLMAAQKEKR